MQAAGAESTQLTVNVNNPGAIQAYVKLGFATIGRRARYEQMAEMTNQWGHGVGTKFLRSPAWLRLRGNCTTT